MNQPDVDIRASIAARNTPAPLPDPDLLREWIGYDAETGMLWWKKGGSGIAAGQPCGTVMPSGHLRVKFKGRLYLAHRLIYLMEYGTDPG
jgi:hypothetical protein